MLASNAVTLDELVHRLTPEVREATLGTAARARFQALLATAYPSVTRFDALVGTERRASQSRATSKGRRPDAGGVPGKLRRLLQRFGLIDPQDRRWLAASNVRESDWLQRFESVILHALYDLNPAEFALLHNLIERLPGGGTVMLFNATANVKPTQFAEWTWQRFVHDEALSDKTFPEFVRSAGPAKDLLERLVCVRCECVRRNF